MTICTSWTSEAEPVSVGDVAEAALGSAVDAAGTALLEPELGQELIEASVLRELGQSGVNAGADASTQVGGAGQDEAEVLVPHEFVAVGLDVVLEGLEAVAPAGKDLFHVAALLHGDDADVVLLVDPDEEVFGVVVPDAALVGPVAGHAGAGEKGRHWLVEEEVLLDEGVLLILAHAGEAVVLALHVIEGFGDDATDAPPLSPGVPRGQGKSADGPAGPDPGRQDVFLIKATAPDLGGVEVGLVLVGGLVAVVASLDDWVEELGKGLVGFFVTGNGTDGHDEGMAWVIDAGLDDMVDGVAAGSLLSPQVLVHFQGKHMGHVVVMVLEIRVLILGGVLGFI